MENILPNILLATDLHLSANEKEYSLNVLKEIVHKARDKDALFLLGDTFNTFDDIDLLKEDFIDIVQSVNTKIFLLKGNHEDLWAYGSDLSKFKFADNVNILAKEPFEIIKIGDSFIFAMPYQNKNVDINNTDFSEYNGVKLFLAHGIIEGLLWQLEDKESLSVVDKNILNKIKPNLAIFGHIHKRIETEIDGVRIIYPGAARVWRRSKSEIGKKYCLSLSIEANVIEKKFIEITSAGEYKTLNFTITDNLDKQIGIAMETCYKDDMVDILLNGIIDDENNFAKIIDSIKNKYDKYVRVLNIKPNKIVILSEARHEAIVKDFLNVADEYLQNTKDKKEREYINTAINIGLEKISLMLKKK